MNKKNAYLAVSLMSIALIILIVLTCTLQPKSKPAIVVFQTAMTNGMVATSSIWFDDLHLPTTREQNREFNYMLLQTIGVSNNTPIAVLNIIRP
jgi:hypothetical protein